MNRKIYLSAGLGLLTLGFGIISLLVIISKRNPYFVKTKLRLGALLITFSGISAGCISPSSCYVPAPLNVFEIDQADIQTNTITISRNEADTLTGKIVARTGNYFSYTITDSSETLFRKDAIYPVDGIYDEKNEEFKIGLNHSILPGKYNLRLYHLPPDSIPNNLQNYRQTFSMTVTE